MDLEIMGEIEKGNVLLLLGFGMRYENPGVGWMVRRFADAGLDPVVIGLPKEFSDLRSEVIGPVMDVERRMGDHVLVGFSLGGLVGAYLQGSRRRIFLSPFWGLNDILKRMGFNLSLKKLKNVNYRLLPRLYTTKDAGPFAVVEDLSTIPEWISVGTLSAMVAAQEGIPPFRDDDIVYLSPQDHLVSQEAVGRMAIDVRIFEGGHMTHLVKDREAIFDGIVDEAIRSLDR